LRYAVSRIFCVGRNYAAHAREMGFDEREPPFYFNKTPVNLLASGATMPYSLGTQNLHHEMELVIAIGKPALRVAPEQALDCVWGYACGLDMTRRDLQFKSRDKGQPWDFGKDFENAAVMAPLAPASEIGHPSGGNIQLSVNGQLKQNGDLKDLIWSVPEVVANLSNYYHLQPGDLIYTGTPEGVGPVKPGDKITGKIDGVGEIALTIGEPA
jgi:fumarylpyruvate hydrolase